MDAAHPVHGAHRCSFQPGRLDPYTRLNAVRVFVRDLDRSVRFYLDRLGFALGSNLASPAGRAVAVVPPDGTAVVELVAPEPDSEEAKLIGRPTQIVFLTEDLIAKFDEWRARGVRFSSEPGAASSGSPSVTFEDADGNTFTLLASEELTKEVRGIRREHAERAEHERNAEQELEFAREAQARLFPQTNPALRTLLCAGACSQARHVGGDYFDYLQLGRERLGLVIGDVSGKGTAAALLMANMQAHMRNLCETYWSRPFTPFALEQPLRFLQTVNRLLFESTNNSTYATLFFAEYDDNSRQLRYANCGHPAGLLLGPDQSLKRLDSTGTVLGIEKVWDGGVSEMQLQCGDTLVLYTDGVTESFDEAGEEFGEQRLVEVLRRRCALEPQALLTCLREEVRRFSPHGQRDDLTLVVARCKGE